MSVKEEKWIQRIALTLLPRIKGATLYKLLIQVDQEEGYLFKATRQMLLGIDGVGPRLAAIILENRQKVLVEAKRHFFYFKENNVQLFWRLDNEYPRNLKQCVDAPMMLYGKGSFDWNKKKIISVVGMRKASLYALERCKRLIDEMTGYDVIVVSGLAFGVDICAHRAALKKSLPTIGVLGHGIDRIYPREHVHTVKVMKEAGGILTEFLPGTIPLPQNFPMRNRIIAGMADALVVVSSNEKGGSMITANLALGYGVDVFAFPDDVILGMPAGGNHLIKSQSAYLLDGFEDIVKVKGWDLESKKAKENIPMLSKEQQRVIDGIGQDLSVNIDVLSHRLTTPISELNILLTQMELMGVLQLNGGNILKNRIL